MAYIFLSFKQEIQKAPLTDECMNLLLY